MQSLPFCLVLAAAACSVPQRDNPRDPVNVDPIPLLDAALALSTGPASHDLITGVVSCGGPETADGAGVSFSRGRCLHFDASGSEIETGNASFAYDLDYTGTDDVTFDHPGPLTDRFAVPAYDVEDGSDVFPQTRKVRVRVTDDTGATSDEVATLQLTNELPVAVGPGVLSVPGQASDDAALTQLVTLSGKLSSDADADTLRYCWSWKDAGVDIVQSEPAGCAVDMGNGEIPDLALFSAAASEKVLSLPAIGNDASVNGRLYVADPTNRALAFASWTVLREPVPMWGFDEDKSELVRLDLRFPSVPLVTAVREPHALHLTDSGSKTFVAISDADPLMLVAQNLDDNYPVGTPPVAADTEALPDNADGESVLAFASDVDSGNFWVLTTYDNPTPSPDGLDARLLRVHLLSNAPGVSVFDWEASLDTQVPVLIPNGAIARVSPEDGSLYCAAFFGQELTRLSWNGMTLTASTVLTAGPGEVLTGIGFRPDFTLFPIVTYEPHILVSRDPFQTGTAVVTVMALEGGTPREIPIEHPDGSSLSEPVAYSLEIAAAISWTNVFGTGLVGLEYTYGSDEKYIVRHVLPEVGLGFELESEFSSGDAWAVSSTHYQISRARQDGSYTTVDSTTRIDGIWSYQQQFQIWTIQRETQSGGHRAFRTVGAGLDRIAARSALDVTSFGLPAVELAGGSTWIGTILPSGVGRLRPDGTLDRFVEFVRGASGDVELPPLGTVAVDPVTNDVWVFPVDSLVSIAASTVFKLSGGGTAVDDPTVAVSDVATPLDLGNYAVIAAAVQPPLGTDPRHVLMLGFEEPAGDLNLIRMRTDGTFTAEEGLVAAAASAGGAVAFSRSLVDGEACVAIERAGEVSLQRWPRNLAAPIVASFPEVQIREISIAAAARTCWIGVETNTSSYVLWWDPEAGVIVQSTMVNFPNSMVALQEFGSTDGDFTVWGSSNGEILRIGTTDASNFPSYSFTPGQITGVQILERAEAPNLVLAQP